MSQAGILLGLKSTHQTNFEELELYLHVHIFSLVFAASHLSDVKTRSFGEKHKIFEPIMHRACFNYSFGPELEQMALVFLSLTCKWPVYFG